MLLLWVTKTAVLATLRTGHIMAGAGFRPGLGTCPFRGDTEPQPGRAGRSKGGHHTDHHPGDAKTHIRHPDQPSRQGQYCSSVVAIRTTARPASFPAIRAKFKGTLQLRSSFPSFVSHHDCVRLMTPGSTLLLGNLSSLPCGTASGSDLLRPDHRLGHSSIVSSKSTPTNHPHHHGLRGVERAVG